ncbi:hypothetical protein [Lysinibacillus sp. NPDC056232]|uniref:hypothetical protein n=1 Tax=Lysinibacillus sp. NPDC056232 TaxID=3345756 RepID=UPI0035D6A415
MTLIIFIIVALAIVTYSLSLTTKNKKNRIMTGIVLMLSVLTYLLTLPLLHETKVIHDLEGTGFLIVFHLLKSLVGMIIIIACIFTKTNLIKSNE